ncbi:enoyl-CoA hydratase/isomerase family protein [Desulfitibacter alkalitolerans]|uniref:enoyl-CoA hydratase/isomerase family protein n=1 Tax=Desulfitibacter alkalitolerans TaxID=264641 RepID=UPI000555D740|nr:enoyl-CoA hydratase-related protein [Desulfitibacter alkalitolerans]
MYQNITYTVEDNIGNLIINRPNSLNSLTRDALNEVLSVLDSLSKDVRVLLVAGAGEKAFAAGADIKEMSDFSPEEAMEYVKLGHKVFNAIEELPIPVIAVIQGYCLGGGLELAMACDIRIASERARFGQPEVGLGIIPGFGGTQRLPRLVGKGIALELMITGSIIDAKRAYEIGLVNHVFSPDLLLEKSYEIANILKAKSSSAISFIKDSVNQGFNISMKEALSYETRLFGLCFTKQDFREGFKAYFEKRKPNFR